MKMMISDHDSLKAAERGKGSVASDFTVKLSIMKSGLNDITTYVD